MKQWRFLIKIMLIAGLFSLFAAVATPSLAQRAADNGTGDIPVTFTLDNLIDAHMQDIQDKIFEYKFEAASDDPAEQARLIQERSGELKNDTAAKKRILMALLKVNNSSMGNHFAGITDEMSASIEKLNNSSKKLQEHAAELAMLNGQDTYTDSIVPLIDDVNNTTDLASKASQASKGKKNDNSGDNPGGNSGGNADNNASDNSGKKK